MAQAAGRPDPLSIVRDFIREGGFRPNDRLPPDREVAATLNLTQAQVRRSMNKLAQQGLVWRHVGKGTFLGQGPEAEQPSAIGALPAATNPRELMEARLAVEPMLARLAAINATAEDFRAFETALGGAEEAEEPQGFQHHDVNLHLAIAQASGNALLHDFLRMIFSDEHQALWGRLKQKIMTPSLLEDYHHHHQRIVEAIRERDPDAAASEMHNHLATVRSQLFPH